MHINMNTKKANGMLIITSMIWGSGFVASQFVLDAGITPVQLICGRMLVASIALNLFFYKRLISLTKEEIKAGVIMGGCLFCAGVFQNFGLLYTAPSVNAFITAVYVILIPFFKFFITKDKPDVYANGSALLTICGIGLISLGEGFSVSLGVPLTLVCAMFYAGQVIYTDKYTKIYDPVKLTIVMVNFCFLCGLVGSAVLAFLYHDLPGFSVKGVGSLVYLGLFSTFAAYLFQNIGQKYTTAVKAAVIMSTEALFGSVFSVLFYQEVLTVRMLAGCVIIFAALVISETKLAFLQAKKILV